MISIAELIMPIKLERRFKVRYTDFAMLWRFTGFSR